MNSEKKEIIITGINGFVGEHLARHLKNEGYSVMGTGRDDEPNPSVVQYIDSYHACDLLDATSINALPLSSALAIVHLAGFATVSESFKNPELYIQGNAKITDNLLSSALSQNFKGRVLIVSTGAVYDPLQEMPLKETSRVGSTAPYPLGKIRAEEVARRYIEKGLDIIIARPFNHIGPGQGAGFLVSDLYEQLKVAQETGSSSISVGNLSTKRDYTDVRDIVRAYTSLVTAPSLTFDTYNVCSGFSYSGNQILDYLKAAMQLNDIESVVDQSRVRPTDAVEIVGDASRLSSELGWQPALSIEKTINDFVSEKSRT